LVIGKSDDGVHLYQKNFPLWSIQKKCRYVEIGREMVLAECFENEKESFPTQYIIDRSGKIPWKGKKQVITSSISRNGNLVAYLDIKGNLKVVGID
jgi:hypothetical protein